MIADNLRAIKQEVEAACALANRSKEEVTLIGVTKSVDAPTTAELIQLGVTDCAENRVDKLLEKKKQLHNFSHVTWHLIGNLQRRKVKLVINEIDYFHALDSLRLAEEIEKRADKVIQCFVEINVSNEATKHGIAPKDAIPFINQLSVFKKINVVGLMTMAPYEAPEEELHSIFQQLKAVQQCVQALDLEQAPCTELSMGMSNDFPIAIQEGATFIRVGTALFKDA